MWNNLEHHVWKILKDCQLTEESTYLLAVSGGLDSMVLTEVFSRLRPQSQIVLMHYHHGPGDNLSYRGQCVSVLKKIKNIVFEFEQSLFPLKSENDFRRARLLFFKRVLKKYKKSYYITAHHQDDVLETRLLKLIRGAGPEGWTAFQDWNGKILRPFFHISKQVLYAYAVENKISWCEDPTNNDVQYLRNWIRHEWLPALEKRSQGAVKTLSQSLQNMLEAVKPQDRFQTESTRYVFLKKNVVSINRAWLESFNTKDQLSVLIRVIKSAFQLDFSTSQIKEAIKRLDKTQNEYTFSVAGLNWIINAQNIVLKLPYKVEI